MAKDWAKAFYTGRQWIDCRTAYMQSQHYICERCGDVASICHHKIWLTPENITDPNISLNHEQLESLCQDCHNLEHHKKKSTVDGIVFDSQGQLIKN